jgi:hypothetical protein
MKCVIDVATRPFLKKAIGGGPSPQDGRIGFGKSQQPPACRFETAGLARIVAPASIGIAAGKEKSLQP